MSWQDIRVVHQLCTSTQPNRKGRLYLDLARLNQTLIRPVQRGRPGNNILSRPDHLRFLILNDASSAYQILKCDGKSSYLTTFFHVGVADTDT